MPRVHAESDGALSPGERVIAGLVCVYVTESMRFSESWASERGVNATDVRAIALLDSASRAGTPLSAGQLGNRLGLSSPATSALIGRLEANGSVQRTRDPKDRRRVLVSLTPGFQGDAAAYFRPMARVVKGATEGFDARELAAVGLFLERLLAGTRALLPGQGTASSGTE